MPDSSSLSTFRKVVELTVLVAAVWAVTAVPARMFLDGPPLEITLLAAALCLIPGIAVLVVLGRVVNPPPEVKIVLVFAATFLRTGGVIGGVLVIHFATPLTKEHGYPLIVWVCGFYLLTLFIETVWLARSALSEK